jgi:hypothetical protein
LVLVLGQLAEVFEEVLNAFFRNAVSIVDDAYFNSHELAVHQLSLLKDVKVKNVPIVGEVAVLNFISFELRGVDLVILEHFDKHFDFASFWCKLQTV